MGFIAVDAGAQLSGRVYEDRNCNGVFDASDRGMAGVALSDGSDVVKTDRSGAYTLSGAAAGRFVFLTTPSGFTIAKHYLPVVTGKAAGYDFALVPSGGKIARDGSHSFIHITDTEISSEIGHEKFVNNVRDYAADQSSAFVIHTGDICYEKGLNAHIKMMNNSNMGLPIRYCIGNHDYVKGAYAEELFENNYGPIYYSFEVGRTHYIVTPMAYGDHKPAFDTAVLYKWLKNDLAAVSDGMSVVVFNHDLQCRDGKFLFGDVDLLKHNLKAWIYGHWHINYVKYFGDVATISTSADKGGIDHSAATFRRVNVDGEGTVTSELIYPYVDQCLAVAYCGGGVLSVNAYNTASRVVAVTANYLSGGKKKSAKLTKITDWNWRSSLPEDAADVVVEAKYSSGATSSSKWQSPQNADLKIEWSSNAGSNIYMSSPIVSRGNLFVGTVDEAGAGRAGVVCFNGVNGEKLWSYTTRNSIKNVMAAAAGRIFAQDAEGYLYAIDEQSGKLIWERKLSVSDPLPSVVEGLAVRGDRLYAGTGKGLAAYDFDGNVVWVNEDWAQNEGTISTFAFTDDLILTSSQWQALFANDLKSGKMVWRADKEGIRFRASTPVCRGGVIYLLSQNSLFILDQKSGEVIVRRALPYNVEVGSSPLFAAGAIIFGTTDAGIQALDAQTLEAKWNVPTGAGLIYTAPYYRHPVSNIESSPVLTAGGNVIIGTADGVVRVIDPSDGRVVGSLNLGAPILTTVTPALLVTHQSPLPAPLTAAYFVADYAGNLYRITSPL